MWLVLPRGRGNANQNSALRQSLGKSAPIDSQDVSDDLPKPIASAAAWYAQHRGESREPIVVLHDRFGLTPKEAIRAIQQANAAIAAGDAR